jgi:hypothetical protein
MKKLSLESLKVTSFATVEPEPGERGTVRGNYLDTKWDCDSTRVVRNCACSLYCPTETCPPSHFPPCIEAL